jgi:hypothetical protein
MSLLRLLFVRAEALVFAGKTLKSSGAPENPSWSATWLARPFASLSPSTHKPSIDTPALSWGVMRSYPKLQSNCLRNEKKFRSPQHVSTEDGLL